MGCSLLVGLDTAVEQRVEERAVDRVGTFDEACLVGVAVNGWWNVWW